MDENILFGYIAISKELLSEDQVRQGISELQKHPNMSLSQVALQKKWIRPANLEEIHLEVKEILQSQDKEKFKDPVHKLKAKVTQQISVQKRENEQEILEKVEAMQDHPTKAISRNAFVEHLEKKSSTTKQEIMKKVAQMQNDDTQRVKMSDIPDGVSDISEEIVVRSPTQFMRNMNAIDILDVNPKKKNVPIEIDEEEIFDEIDDTPDVSADIRKKVEAVQNIPTQIMRKKEISPQDINPFTAPASGDFSIDLQENTPQKEEKKLKVPDTEITETGKKKPDNVKNKPTENYLLSFDNYQIVSEIARGGMGIVYKAKRKDSDELVAIKVMKRFDATNPKYVARFQREIESARKLNHPHIVAIYDAGEIDGTPYFTMEYVEGVTLSQYAKQKKLSVVESVKIMKKIAIAIDHAHQHHIIHRDLKPANIIIDKHGEPHITDFGLAKDTSMAIDLTQSGIILGTPYYMSPEQSLANKEQIGAASDIFSMGVILYELLTEKLPFTAEDVSKLYRKIAYDHPPKTRKMNKRIGNSLETIVEKALAKKPHRRYFSAVDFANDLDCYLNNQPIEAKPAPLWLKCLEKIEKHQIAILCTLFVLLLVSAFYFLVIHNN